MFASVKHPSALRQCLLSGLRTATSTLQRLRRKHCHKFVNWRSLLDKYLQLDHKFLWTQLFTFFKKSKNSLRSLFGQQKKKTNNGIEALAIPATNGIISLPIALFALCRRNYLSEKMDRRCRLGSETTKRQRITFVIEIDDPSHHRSVQIGGIVCGDIIDTGYFRTKAIAQRYSFLKDSLEFLHIF